MSQQLKPSVNKKDHVEGNTSAVIELVEYGDYECPHCGRAYPIVKDLQKQLGDNLKFVFRNFPLPAIHPHAVNAAVATEAAALQNKFWEMHDVIYERQDKLQPEHIIEYAKELGLNIEQFNSDMQRPELLEKVDADFESGLRSGVNATPTFFVNGEKYNQNWDHGVFIEKLRELLESMKKSPVQLK